MIELHYIYPYMSITICNVCVLSESEFVSKSLIRGAFNSMSKILYIYKKEIGHKILIAQYIKNKNIFT